MSTVNEKRELKGLIILLYGAQLLVAAMLTVLWIFGGVGDVLVKSMITVGALIMDISAFMFIYSKSLLPKYIVFIIGTLIGTISLIVSVTGCSSVVYTPPVNQDWITPSEVKVSNYSPGKEADGYIRIHNGDEATMQTERWEVITEPNETQFPICLKAPVADIATVMVTSDNPDDTPAVAWYDDPTKQIGLKGFLPDAHRIITITYESVRQFTVTVRLPDHCLSGYTPITTEALPHVIVDTKVNLQARETLDVPIVLNVPDDVELGNQPIEFWVTVMDANPGMIGTEMAQRWLINGE